MSRYSKNDYETGLARSRYSESGINKALEQSNVDWEAQADKMAKSLIENKDYTAEELVVAKVQKSVSEKLAVYAVHELGTN